MLHGDDLLFRFCHSSFSLITAAFSFSIACFSSWQTLVSLMPRSRATVLSFSLRFLEELWIRGLHELFPVVVVSATGRWATAIEYGAFDFMQKPFDVGKLKEVVGRALQLKGRSR